jgi:hypothetical protein
MDQKRFFMKNLFKTLGIIALVAVIGFTMTACPPEPTAQDVVGATLSLIDKPVTVDPSATGCTATNFGYLYRDEYTPLDPLSNYITGSPSVTYANGKATLNLGAVNSSLLRPVLNYTTSGSVPSGFTISTLDAKWFTFSQLCNNNGYYWLEIKNATNGIASASLVYVDKDVTLNGTRTVNGTTWTYNNVSLKQGWNYYIYSDRTGTTGNYQRTVTAGRTLPSGYNWVLNSDGDPALNGTWVDDGDNQYAYNFNEGNFQIFYNGGPILNHFSRGTYYTSGNILTFIYKQGYDGTNWLDADADEQRQLTETPTYTISGRTLTLTYDHGSYTYTKQ